MQAEQHIKYYNSEQLFILQLEGEVRFTLACALMKIFSLIEKSSKEELIDLTHVRIIDSTVLGLFMQHVIGKENLTQHKPTILCNPEIKGFFSRIGADNFFYFKETDKRIKQLASQFTCIEASAVKNDLISYVESAHQGLQSNLSTNEFGIVIDSLKHHNKKKHAE